mgnify:CR=1 FL=1
MIEQITLQYKESLYDVVQSYNGKDEEFINIKINLIEEKMINYGLIEDYDNAILLQNKIKELKNKIKKDDI